MSQCHLLTSTEIVLTCGGHPAPAAGQRPGPARCARHLETSAGPGGRTPPVTTLDCGLEIISVYVVIQFQRNGLICSKPGIPSQTPSRRCPGQGPRPPARSRCTCPPRPPPGAGWTSSSQRLKQSRSEQRLGLAGELSIM